MLQAKNKEVVSEPAHAHPEPEAERDNGQRLNVDHNGDPFFGKRLSTQVTPFSQASYETAGTAAEVSEAMAVSITPHQNKSVVVVQQRAPSEPSPPTLKAIDTSLPPKVAVNGTAAMGPVTPPQPIHPMDEIDSPLRNPRAPPEPPAIKFIPPTPAALTPGAEEDRQLGHNLDDGPASSDDKPKRGMSLMRRAFSNRRNSESTAQQPGLFRRTFSLSNNRRDLTDHATQTSKETANPSTLYPSVADRPADGSKLHPFWRPAHFWDDLEDHEGDYDDDYGQYPIVDNRPAPPKRSFSQKLKRTFAILPIEDDDYDYHPAVDRRTMRRTPSGNMRVVKQRSNTSLRREGSDRRQYAVARPMSGPSEGSFGYGFKEGNGGRIHTIPGLGVGIEYIGWSGMRRKLSERRREQRSEKLRATISGPKGVQSGVDDVLRTRTH
jgi:hypothetical protein